MRRRLSADAVRSLASSVTPFLSVLRRVNCHRRRVVVTAQRHRAVAVAAAAVAALGLAGCAGGTSIGFGSSAEGSRHAGVVAWTNATRLPGFQLYAREHPGAKISIQSYNGDTNGSNYLQTELELDNQVGKGWPDMVFSEVPNDVIWAAEPQLPLRGGAERRAGAAVGDQRIPAGRGCGELRVFRSIALPLARPAVALVAFFAFSQRFLMAGMTAGASKG